MGNKIARQIAAYITVALTFVPCWEGFLLVIEVCLGQSSADSSLGNWDWANAHLLSGL